MNNRILYIPKEKKKYKKSKSRYRIWMLGSVGVIIILMIAGFIIVRLPMLRIQKISLSGLNSIHEDEVQKEMKSILEGSYAGLVPYRFLPFFPRLLIAARIKEAFPLIVEVRSKKEFPHTLALYFKERELFGILCNDLLIDGKLPEERSQSQCAYIDTQGIAYQRSPISSGFLITKISTDTNSVPVIEQAVEKPMMDRMIFLRDTLPAVLGSSLMGFEIMSAVSREIRAVSSKGFTLIFKRDDNFENVLRVLKTVLEREIGAKRNRLAYIDLRFGNKVFFKYK